MLFYVNIYGSYKLSKNSPVFWPTLYMHPKIMQFFTKYTELSAVNRCAKFAHLFTIIQ